MFQRQGSFDKLSEKSYSGGGKRLQIKAAGDKGADLARLCILVGSQGSYQAACMEDQSARI